MMPAVSATRPVEPRHELRRVGARVEQRDFVGMVPVGTSLASAASLVVGGSQHEAQRELERASRGMDAPDKFCEFGKC